MQVQAHPDDKEVLGVLRKLLKTLSWVVLAVLLENLLKAFKKLSTFSTSWA
jgi:hypothetical protein